MYLLGDADDTAGRSGTSVASLEGLLVSTLAKVVSAGVNDDGSLSREVSHICPPPVRNKKEDDIRQ